MTEREEFMEKRKRRRKIHTESERERQTEAREIEKRVKKSKRDTQRN